MEQNEESSDTKQEKSDNKSIHAVPQRSRPQILSIASITPVFESTVAYFNAIPWCRELLSAKHGTIAFAPHHTDGAGNMDRLTASSLATARGIAYMLYFFQPDDSFHAEDPTRPVQRISALVFLGPDLAGWSTFLHGGISALLLDHVPAVLSLFNVLIGKTFIPLVSAMTVTLHVHYQRPIPVGNVYCISAAEGPQIGRKKTFRSEIASSTGEKLAVADIIRVSPSKL